MKPTIEEVKKVAIECGLNDEYWYDYSEELLAFAQHYKEEGARSTLNATHTCRSCSISYTQSGDNEDCPYCGCDGTDEWVSIHSTGE